VAELGFVAWGGGRGAKIISRGHCAAKFSHLVNLSTFTNFRPRVANFLAEGLGERPAPPTPTDDGIVSAAGSP